MRGPNTSTFIAKPKELPSLEEATGILAGAAPQSAHLKAKLKPKLQAKPNSRDQREDNDDGSFFSLRFPTCGHNEAPDSELAKH